MFKATKRQAQSDKLRHSLRSSRAYLHIVNRLKAERDASKLRKVLS